MYKYYSYLEFLPINTQRGRKKNRNEIFNNIPYFIKNPLHVDRLQDCFVIHNDKLILSKIKVINPINDSTTPVDYCKNHH